MKTIKKVRPNGDIIHFNINGKLHREDGAAVIWPDGHEFYWLNGTRYSYVDWLEVVNRKNRKTNILNLLVENNIDFTVEIGKVIIPL